MNPSPKVTDQQKRIIKTSFGFSSQDQCIETNKKRILTHFLNRWNENKSIAHPSTCTFSPDKTVPMKIYSIELK